MMKRKVTQKDLEKLSAYLDGYLNPQQRSRLGARLKEDPGLMAALSDLQRTRLAIRSMPEIQAPRSYTLSPEMIGVKPDVGVKLFPVFRLATAIASILFVFVVLGDFLSVSGFIQTDRTELASPEIVALEEFQQAPKLAVDEPPIDEGLVPFYAEAESFPGEEEKSGISEGESSAPTELAANTEEEPAMEVMSEAPVVAEVETFDKANEMTPEEKGQLVPEETLISDGSPPEDASVRGGEDLGPIMEEEVPIIDQEPTVIQLPPTDDDYWVDQPSGEIVTKSVQMSDDENTVEKRIPIIRVVEVVFGSIAVISGIVTFVFRRKE